MDLFRHFARVPPPSSNFGQKETGMCQRFLRGNCPFSALACPYSHNKDQAPLCMRWKQGECIGATGNKCLYRHYYLERDSRIVPAQRLALAEVDPANFSSPYQVKICKEKLTHRREEVDIETGRRRSWVEEEEREVFDLTGDTPAKPLIKARSKSAHGNRYEGSPPPTLALTPMRTTRRSSIILFDSPSLLLPSPSSTTPLPVPRRKSGSTSNPPRNPPPMQATPPADLIPAATATPIAAGTCPVCHRTGFAGEKGVKAHRCHRNSKCKYQEEVTPNPVISVIEIMDTPELPVQHTGRRTRRSLTSMR